MTSSIPEQTAALFVQTARATQRAQRSLDAMSSVLPHSYAIPRVRVGAKFSVTEVHGKTAILFGHRSEEQHENQVNFGLNLAPERVDAVRAASPLLTAALLPGFLVPPASHARPVERLKNYLTALDPERYASEIAKIDDAFASRTHDPGFVFLALQPPGRHLLVRLGHRTDGIYLMDESTPGDFQVISHWGRDPDRLPWRIFHELFDVFRTWQSHALTDIEISARDLPEKFGAIGVREFADDIWTGYCRAREQLALSEPIESAMPAYYELREVSAVLNYSVPPESDGAAGSTAFIRSQVKIAIDDTNLAAPRIPIRLVAPEFVLTGESRGAIIKRLFENLQQDESDRGSLWRVLDPEYRGEYERAFHDPDRLSSALVLLSYRGKSPQNQFLFVWTGVIDNEEREFAFTLRFDGARLVDPRMVLPLEDPIHPSGSGIPSPQNPFSDAAVKYDRDHPGLHDFFHAVWIWTLSGGWF